MQKIDNIIKFLSTREIFTLRLGIARSILASSTLLTLLFNDPNIIFTAGNTETWKAFTPTLFLFQKLNFFVFCNNLEFARWAAILILCIVVSGWRPRITCIFHFWICLSFMYSCPLIEGGDQIASNIALLLIPISLADNREWHWYNNQKIRPLNNLTANFFLEVIKLQMCLIYFHAAVGKMAVEDWGNGTAAYYWLNDPTFGIDEWLRPIFDPILKNAYGVVIVTWGTILLEILLFMAILMQPSYKKVLFCLGVFFHIAILVVHGLFSFCLVMIAGLILYLCVDKKNNAVISTTNV